MSYWNSGNKETLDLVDPEKDLYYRSFLWFEIEWIIDYRKGDWNQNNKSFNRKILKMKYEIWYIDLLTLKSN